MRRWPFSISVAEQTFDAALPFRRIAIVGHSCTGKTTLSHSLAKRLDLPHLELDAAYWQAGWKPTPDAEFRAQVAAFVEQPSWVVDGNDSRAQDLVFSCADTVVWLDYPLPLVLARVLRRSVERAVTKQTLWNGNVETLSRSLFSKDGLPLWVLKTHRRRRDRYRAVIGNSALAARWVRLRSPRELQLWFKAVVP